MVSVDGRNVPQPVPEAGAFPTSYGTFGTQVDMASTTLQI